MVGAVLSLTDQPNLSGPVLMLVHYCSVIHPDDSFRRRCKISQCAMRPDGVIVNAPMLDQDLGFAQDVEDLAVE